jgi:hypothetical protein
VTLKGSAGSISYLDACILSGHTLAWQSSLEGASAEMAGNISRLFDTATIYLLDTNQLPK